MISRRRVALSVLFLVLIAAGFFATSVDVGQEGADAYFLVPVIGSLVGIASVFGLVAVFLYQDRDAAAAEMTEWRGIRAAGRSAYIWGFVGKSVIPILAGVLLSRIAAYANGYPFSSAELFNLLVVAILALAAIASIRLAIWNRNERRFAAPVKRNT